MTKSAYRPIESYRAPQKFKADAVPGSMSGGENRGVLSLVGILSADFYTICINAFSFLF